MAAQSARHAASSRFCTAPQLSHWTRHPPGANLLQSDVTRAKAEYFSTSASRVLSQTLQLLMAVASRMRSTKRRSRSLQVRDDRLATQSVRRKQVAMRAIDVVKRVIKREGIEPALCSAFPRNRLHPRVQTPEGGQLLEHQNVVMCEQCTRDAFDVERLQRVHGDERDRSALPAEPYGHLARELDHRPV